MKPRSLLLLCLALLAMLFATSARGADPVPVTSVLGKKVVFSVTLEKGTPPFLYQWQKNGAPIAGATLPTLTLPKVTDADVGVYTVKISNPRGATVSDPGTIFLVEAPSGAKIQQASSEPDPS